MKGSVVLLVCAGFGTAFAWSDGDVVLCPRFLTTVDSSSTGEPFIVEVFNRGLKVGESESAAVARLGTPRARVVEPIVTPYRVVPDTIVRLRYPGLEVAFLMTSDGHELLGAVTLSAPGCSVAPELTVGAPVQQMAQLGRAAVRQTRGDTLVSKLEVPLPSPVSQYINVKVVRDTIRIVQWQFGID